jgi:hypothetical protein
MQKSIFFSLRILFVVVDVVVVPLFLRTHFYQFVGRGANKQTTRRSWTPNGKAIMYTKAEQLKAEIPLHISNLRRERVFSTKKWVLARWMAIWQKSAAKPHRIAFLFLSIRVNKSEIRMIYAGPFKLFMNQSALISLPSGRARKRRLIIIMCVYFFRSLYV